MAIQWRFNVQYLTNLHTVAIQLPHSKNLFEIIQIRWTKRKKNKTVQHENDFCMLVGNKSNHIDIVDGNRENHKSPGKFGEGFFFFL